jgi:hypothetical protein
MEGKAEKALALGLAALEDDSEEARLIFAKSFDEAAGSMCVLGGQAMATMMEKWVKKKQWDGFDPLESYLRRKQANKGAETIVRLSGYAMISRALLQMGSVFGESHEQGQGARAEDLFNASLGRCLVARWKMLGDEQARAAELDRCSGSKHAWLASAAERYHMEISAQDAPAKAKARSL